VGFQARREIDAIAKRRDFHALRMADSTDNYLSHIHADADLQRYPVGYRMPAEVELSEGRAHFQSGMDGMTRVLLGAVRVNIPPRRHDSIANEFLERPVSFKTAPTISSKYSLSCLTN